MFRRRLAALAIASFATAETHADFNYEAQRRAMVREIENEVTETSAYTGIDALDAVVVDALRAVPRHEFVPQADRTRAYVNRALPIGEQQTISQPFVVAMMTQLAGVRRESRVLEIVCCSPIGDARFT